MNTCGAIRRLTRGRGRAKTIQPLTVVVHLDVKMFALILWSHFGVFFRAERKPLVKKQRMNAGIPNHFSFHTSLDTLVDAHWNHRSDKPIQPERSVFATACKPIRQSIMTSQQQQQQQDETTVINIQNTHTHTLRLDRNRTATVFGEHHLHPP